MRVYIIRHGESENNRKGLWTGWIDALLTDMGKAEAKKAGEILGQVSFDKIYTSDLTRAIETAQNAIPGCQYETVSLLREIDVGTLAGKPLSVITDEQRAITAKSGYGLFGGETKEVFQSRIAEFMKMLEQLNCSNVAVFSHAGWLRSFFDRVVGVSLPRKNICCNNCAVGIFEYENSNWRLHSWINLR